MRFGLAAVSVEIWIFSFHLTYAISIAGVEFPFDSVLLEIPVRCGFELPFDVIVRPLKQSQIGTPFVFACGQILNRIHAKKCEFGEAEHFGFWGAGPTVNVNRLKLRQHHLGFRITLDLFRRAGNKTLL